MSLYVSQLLSKNFKELAMPMPGTKGSIIKVQDKYKK